MSLTYCDTSALLDLVDPGPREPDVARLLQESLRSGRTLATSAIAVVEFGRYLQRRAPADDTLAERIDRLLAEVDLIDLSDLVLSTAAALPVRHLGSLDALHVATAQIIGADVVITRDQQMARACADLGITVA